jgi:hypothetical protein
VERERQGEEGKAKENRYETDKEGYICNKWRNRRKTELGWKDILELEKY